MEARVMNTIFKPKQAESGVIYTHGAPELREPLPWSLDEPALSQQIQDLFYALIERLRVWH